MKTPVIEISHNVTLVVRSEAEKWARPLRSNYELHNAFIKLDFKDFEDLSNKLKVSEQ